MEYIEGSSPVVAVGEFWDDCVYTDSKLEYNQVCVACRMCASQTEDGTSAHAHMALLNN